jgi:hypothetical protein
MTELLIWNPWNWNLKNEFHFFIFFSLEKMSYTIFEIAEKIKYNFTPTNKNILFQNLSQEADKDMVEYAIFKKYIKDINDVEIKYYYESNVNRHIINSEDKFYPV